MLFEPETPQEAEAFGLAIYHCEMKKKEGMSAKYALAQLTGRMPDDDVTWTDVAKAFVARWPKLRNGL